MADSDSFINEVTEEVRRDRLYALMRRWGWVPALAVVGLVGGAAYFEWQGRQQEAEAQTFGDALIAGLDRPELDARLDALDAIEPTSPEAAMILSLFEAGELAASGDEEAAAAGLRGAAETPGIARRYRDLALLRAEMLDPSEPSQARIVLETLAEPGAPYAALAQEQLALLELRAGNRAAALELFRGIEENAASTVGLQQRASQLIVALEAGSTLVETAPEPAGTPDEDVIGAPTTPGLTLPVVPEAAPSAGDSDTGAEAPEDAND